ncbi:MAG: ABC transporter permease [Finegoldia magna]|nr:ABC transporter permease [Finegoldia magna]
MTGQILSGVSPNTAIIYQISVMIAICASVNIASFLSLYLGYKSLINNREQINFEL